MWLADVNVPSKITKILEKYGIDCHRTDQKGWAKLQNGALVSLAVANGYTCILTRDRLFGESASRALKKYPQFSVVLITLRQAKENEYCKSFTKTWMKNPIEPVAGELIVWG